MSKMFQFHKGTIRTGHVQLEHAGGYRFNSIKVRLELAAVNARLSALFAWFQFHKGTIRTLSLARLRVGRLVSIP